MLKMGCAKSDITPSWDVYLHGYSGRNRLSSKQEGSLELGVIALEQEKKRSLIITVDCLGVKTSDCRRIEKMISEETGIDSSNIIICGSHTHFAPALNGYTIFVPGGELTQDDYPADEKFESLFFAKLIPAVKYALDDLEEVRLLQADIPVTGIAFNRRTIRKSDSGVTTNYIYPPDPENYTFQAIDPTLHLWKFMRGDHPKGLLARYGCHPVTGGYDTYAMSPDYPGFFRQYVQEKLGCPGFFMLGTAGDVVPAQRNNETRKDLGEVLASIVRLSERQFRETTDFTLKNLAIPFPVNAPALKGRSREDIVTKWKNLLAEGIQSDDKYTIIFKAALESEVYRQFNSHEAELSIRLMQLGDRTIAALPFEVLTMIGTKIREAFPETAVVSCSCGYEGYLPLKEDFPKGGYETELGAAWAEDTGDRVIETVIAAMKTFL